MRNFIAGSLAVTLVLSISTTRMSACGDKLLAVGRFGYFRGYAAIHPASILIYVPNAKKTSSVGADLVSAMRRAGHDAQVATDRAGLERALGTHEIDVVVANVDAMPDAQAAAAGGEPRLLPVLYDRPAADVAAAASRYGFVVKDPDMNTLLAKIDEAMASRPTHVRARKH